MPVGLRPSTGRERLADGSAHRRQHRHRRRPSQPAGPGLGAATEHGPRSSLRIRALAEERAPSRFRPQATRLTLSPLARRIERLTAQIDELNRRLTRLVERHAPQLLVPVRIGPDNAVTLLIARGDNPEWLNTEASFAALCGVSPIEYSSGRRSSRRLNGGGDRQADAALHRIVFTRLRFDLRTQAYRERRTQEGKTRREIIRCLKRYAAREVFNLVRAVSSAPRYRGVFDGKPLQTRPEGASERVCCSSGDSTAPPVSSSAST